MIEDPEIRRMKLSELRPADYNPRKISESAFKGLGQSIDRFGVMVPIIWNERTGNIVGGHQRFKLLTEEGEAETDVVVVDLDDQEEVALNIALNNKFMRGRFTKDVVNLLEKVEVQIGSVFNDIGLSDLHNQVKRMKFEIESPEPPNTEPPEPQPPSTEPPDAEPDPTAPSAAIRCPRCRSAWRMDNSEVIHNAIAK